MTAITSDAITPAHGRTGRWRVAALDPGVVEAVRSRGVDHLGLPVEPFVDDADDGGWPLRCCLTDSKPGDLLAIVAINPFPWRSAYSTTGPVVIHAGSCPRQPDGRIPPQFEQRRQILRAFGTVDGRRHSQLYELNRFVEPGAGLCAEIDDLLSDPRVELVQSCNVLAGCHSFLVHR